jgi:hypothetical protein
LKIRTTRRVLWIGAAAWLLILNPLEVHGQSVPSTAGTVADPAVEAFLEVARRATSRYQRRTEAIRDGYRLLGPDFPGMGEHWIHPGLMVGARFDPARPQVLTYANVQGEPRLLGVAYALALSPEEAPPDFPPGANLWHDHTGSIDEESVLLNHAISGASPSAGLRIAMLHAWIWLDNPDGVFSDNNWSLPFVRLGLPPPSTDAVPAARALSLASGGDRYYRALFRAIGRADEADDMALEAAIRHSTDEVARWLEFAERESPLDGEQIESLRRIWEDLASRLEQTVSPAVADRLRPIWTPAHVH